MELGIRVSFVKTSEFRREGGVEHPNPSPRVKGKSRRMLDITVPTNLAFFQFRCVEAAARQPQWVRSYAWLQACN